MKLNILWCECTVLCLGARTNIKDSDKQTPLQVAKEQLSDESDAEPRQRYEKVHEEHTYHRTISYFNGYMLTEILYNINICLSSRNLLLQPLEYRCSIGVEAIPVMV